MVRFVEDKVVSLSRKQLAGSSIPLKTRRGVLPAGSTVLAEPVSVEVSKSRARRSKRGRGRMARRCYSGYKRKYRRSGGVSRGLLPGYEVVKLIKRDAKNSARQAAARAVLKGLGPPGSSQLRMDLLGPSGKKADSQQKIMREVTRYKGAGDYRGMMAGLSRGIGGVAGAGLGFMQGGIHGLIDQAQAGYGQGAKFSRMMGWGDYGSVSGNQIVDGSGSQQQIAVNQDSLSGDVFISHTEFVQNVFATGTGGSNSTFQIVSFPLNPGLPLTFPFISQISQNYELYQFEGLIFQYKPTSGEYGNNNSNSIGKVIMATNYDPDASAFLNSVQMENYDYANSSKPSCGMVHGVETAPGTRSVDMLYVRTGVSTKDKVFTDIGTFFVATEGVPFGGAGPQTALLGELWVTYRIRLSRANLFGSLLGANIGADVFTGTSTAGAVVSTVVPKSTNTIGCVVSNVNATTLQLTWPVNVSLGYYQVVLEFNNSAGMGTTIVGGTSNLTNCSAYYPGRALPGAGGPENLPFPAPAATSNLQQIGVVTYLKVQAPGNSVASIRLFVSTALPLGTTYQLVVLQQNGIVAEAA